MDGTITSLPQLPALTGSIPGHVLNELETAKSNWTSVYGSVARFVDFVPLGRIVSDANRAAVIRWVTNQSPILTGNLLASDSLKPVAPSQLAASPEERQAFETRIAELIALGDLVIELRWTDAGGSRFSTLTIAGSSCCSGIKYDSMLANALLIRQVFVPPTEAETDTFHQDFGWIWAPVTGSYTRGHVDFKLTCIPDPPGCRWSRDCSMNLGSCDVGILPDPPVKTGRCCNTSSAWAVATGPVSVTVGIGATGALAVTASGVFGSVAKGAGSLQDCCPPPPTPPPPATAPPLSPPPPPPAGQPPPPESGGGTVTGQGHNTVVKKPDGTTVVVTPTGVTIIVKPDGGVIVIPAGGGDLPGNGGVPHRPAKVQPSPVKDPTPWSQHRMVRPS